MKIHKEGYGLIVGIFVVLLAINLSFWAFCKIYWLNITISVISAILYLLVINFFRYIERKHPLSNDNKAVVAPADGKVVVVEEVEETQILGERCIQVSIFMNIFNMHVNWIPVNGVVVHSSHQKGRFMAANLPKASTENERSAVVIRTADDKRVLVRQVAGAVAQRIVTYPKVGDKVNIDQNLGFIKFGSRVDIYLPLGTEVLVKVGDKTDGNITTIAKLP